MVVVIGVCYDENSSLRKCLLLLLNLFSSPMSTARTTMRDLGNFAREYLSDESGQGITEYGAVLAFVAILVALVFSITQGALSAASSKAFSAVVKQLSNVSAAAGSAS